MVARMVILTVLVAVMLACLVGIGGASAATIGDHGDYTPAASHPPAIGSVNGTALGNVFLTTETATFEVSAEGDTEWRVENYWDEEVAGGTVDAGGGTTLSVDHSTPGYYELTVGSGERAVTRSFAIVRPHDFSQYDESFFMVQGHFNKGQPLELIPLIRTVGAKHVRDGQLWHVIERSRGEFSYPSHYTRMMERFERNDIEPLLGLWYGNTLYYEPAEGTADRNPHFTAPFDDTGREAYARYAREIVSRYSELQYVEVWNEYNHDGHFAQGPAGGDPAGYAKTLEYGYDAVKGERSSVTVLGGGTGGIPFDYLEGVLANGSAEHMDALSVHPYRRRYAPEEAGFYGFQEAETESIGSLQSELERVRSLTAEYNDGEPLPIWGTEYGYVTRNHPKKVTVEEQTKYLPRSHVMAQAAGLVRFNWYQFRSGDAGNGLVRPTSHPKGGHAARPAYAAYATMTRQLTGATPEGRESITVDDTYVDPAAVSDQFYSYRYDRDGEPVRVVWAMSPTQATIETDDPLTVTDMMGRRSTLEPTDGTVALDLTSEPVYVAGSLSDISVRVPAALLTNVTYRGGRITGVEDRSGAIDVRVENVAKRSLTIEEARWRIGEDSERTASETTLKAGETAELSVAARELSYWSETHFSGTIDFGPRGTVALNRSASFNPAWEHSLTVDGETEVSSLPGLDLTEAGSRISHVDDPADPVGASVWVTHDEETVYVTAVVADDVHHTGDSPWKGDAFRLGLAPGWAPSTYGSMEQFTIARIDGEIEVAGVDRETLDVAIDRRAGQNETVYEVAVPVSLLGRESAPEAIGFDAMIIDNDGPDAPGDKWGRNNALSWTRSVTALNNPTLLEPVHLVESSGPVGSAPDAGSGARSATPDGGVEDGSSSGDQGRTATSAPGVGGPVAVLGALLALLLARRSSED